MFLITGCFSWIGYHLLAKLLNDGEEVIGVDQLDNDKKEHFAMLVGRNANFTFYETTDQAEKWRSNSKLNTMFQIDLSEHRSLIHFSSKYASENEQSIEIELPLLYGEWMERSETGFYYKGEFVRFDSKQFENSAIYIEDFVNAVSQLSETTLLPSTIMYCAHKQSRVQKTNNEQLFILPYNSQFNILEKIDSHYQRFNSLY